MKTTKKVFSILLLAFIPIAIIASIYTLFMFADDNMSFLLAMKVAEWKYYIFATLASAPIICIVSGVIGLSTQDKTYGGFIAGGLLLICSVAHFVFVPPFFVHPARFFMPVVLLLFAIAFILIAILDTALDKNRPVFK